jgi:thiol-disulfide isomerase/thioredoxin
MSNPFPSFSSGAPSLLQYPPTLTRPYPSTRRHCKALVPTWESLAKELAGEVAVARVNGPKHKALLKRLRVTAYPTILYLRDGTMREYDGGKRTTAALAAFGRSGYKDAAPVPWYRAPNSLAGKLTGAFFRLPVDAEALYTRAKKRTGFSDVTVLLICLSVPVGLGVLAVAAADAYVTRAAKHAGARRRQREAGNHALERDHPHRD